MSDRACPDCRCSTWSHDPGCPSGPIDAESEERAPRAPEPRPLPHAHGPGDICLACALERALVRADRA